jgi:transmembrane sensor
MTNHDASNSSDPPEEVVCAARAWVELIAERDLTTSERVSFEEWLRDPDHEMEFHLEFEIRFRLAELSSERQALRSEAAPPSSPRYLPERRPWNRPRLAAAAAVVLLAIGAVWIGLPRQHYVTGTGEKLSTYLADGTRVELNAQTDLEWLGAGRCDRRVRLVRGEALFNVHGDPRCPFQVLVGRGRIEVLGTEFDVHQDGNGEERVSVLEGRVRLHGPSGVTPWQMDLGAGQQATWSSGPPSTRKLEDPSKATAWSGIPRSRSGSPIPDCSRSV